VAISSTCLIKVTTHTFSGSGNLLKVKGKGKRGLV